MSSHWEWAEQKIKEHEDNKPFAPENGQPLRFKAGDAVIYTNDYGIEFRLTVTGLYLPNLPDLHYALGQRYNLDWNCPWVSVREDSLRLDHSWVYAQQDA